MALDLRPERYGSKPLASGAELTGAEILSRVKPAANSVQNTIGGDGLNSNSNSNTFRWLHKYRGKGYESLASSLRNLEEGEEKNWLRQYAQKVDYDEKMALDLDAYEAGIQDLLKQYDTYKNAKQGDITAAPGKTAQETLMDLLEETGIEIDRRKQYLTLAKRLQEQAAGQEQYSQVTQNADFAQKSGYDSGNQEIGYRYVNADTAGKLDLEQQYGQYAKQFADRGFDSLSEDEKAIYNYYMNTGDRDEAARYLKYLEEELQIRKGTEADAYVDRLVEDNPKANALRYAFMANVGYDQHLSGLQGAGNLIAGKDEYVPATATQVAGQLVREDLGQQGKQLPAWLGGGSTGQMLGDLISTTANMVPSMVMGLVSPNAGAAMMGVSAAGGAYQEKINEGFTKEQSRKYGIAIGASEAALGAALGGIKSLGGAVTNHVVDNALKGIKNGVGRFFAEWGTRIGSEALEEGIQEILTPMFSNLLLNTDKKVDWSEVAYSALLGGLSAGVLEVGDAYSGAKKATAEKSTAVDDKRSATQLTEDIDSFARQYGKQAGAVKQNYLEGQDLQEYEVGFQAAYAMGRESGKKEGLQQVPYLSQSQKDIAYSMGRDAAEAEKAEAEKARVQKMPKATLMSQDGESSPVSIAEVVSMDDDAMTFRLEDGSTVTDDALTFDKGQQVLSAVWETGMDVEAANAILADMETNPATDADQAAGIDEAYRYGSHGYSMEQLTKNGTDAAALTENQRKAAYEAGVNARQAAAVAAPAAKTEKSTTSTGVYLDAGEGNVAVIDDDMIAGYSDAAKTGVHAAQVLQKLGVGGSFYFYESYVNDTGERVYKDAEGNEKKAPNGWYDPKDDSIHIDLNAGGSVHGLTLYTLSHELTHFVEKRSKEKYRALADFLAESYGKQGESVDALVIAKQKKLNEIRDKPVTYDEAYAEFIADSMEAMLSDGKALEKLTELKKKDRGLFDAIREFFENLVKDIRKFYGNLVPDSAEGKMVLQMKDQIEQIQQLFAEALMDAETESVAPTIQFSERKNSETKAAKNPYAYDTLISKPDMYVTLVDGNVPQNRADLVSEAKKNAAIVGKTDPKTGSVSVHVNDIDSDVIIGRDGLKHSIDRRLDVNAPVILKAGEILSHSIRINELNPKKDNVSQSYVLIGAARNAANELYIVRSVVNRFTNELASMDVLYAINAKKEPAALLPLSTGNPALGTDSTISIKNFLDYVNQYFPDILPEDVLKHYGYDARPEGELGQYALYSDRVIGTSNRALLAGAFEELVRSPEELKFMQDYRENVELLNAEEEKLQELRMQIRELTFGKGRKDPAKLAELQAQAETVAKEIDRYDRKLLKLETAKPLRDVLARERQKAEKKANQKKQEAVAEYREKRQESAARKEARKKIRRTVFELENLLNRGDKKKNVKAGMNAMVSSSLKLADALFMDEYSNRDMIRNGVGVQLTDREEQAMREAQRLLGQIESGAALEGMEFASEIEAMEQLKKLDSRLSAKMAALKDVFARERKRLYGTQVSELIGKLAEEYSALSEAEDGAVRAAKDENVYAHLLQLQKDVKNVTVRDMSLEQLKMVADAYTMVLTTVRNANKMFAKNLQFKRDALAGMVMNEVSAAAKKVSNLVKPGKNLKDSFSWNNLKPVYAFERLGSETLKTLYGNIRKGQDVWSRDMQEADAFRRAQYKKHGWKKWDPEKLHKFEFESGIVELNLGQIMSLYAYSRREAAMDHLIKGGFVFDRNTEVVVKKNGMKRRYLKKDATAYNLTADELLTVIDTLSKEQKAFVEDMQTYLSDVMGGKGNEVSLKMYGIRSFGEKNYFPLRSARQYMEKAKEDSFRKEQGQISIANSGFTKAVTPHASNPITLDGFMDVWSEHVNEMSMYHGFVLPMEDFRRVYNYSSPNVEVGNSKSVNAAIENTFGEAATGYIDQLYKDLNGGAVSDNRETIGKKLVGLHKKAAVFASWSVVIQQPSAFVRSFALIDPKYFMGAKVDRKRHEQLWAELKEYAPVAFVKEMGYFDTGMGRSAKDYLQAEEYSGIREKMTALLTDEAYRDEQLGKAPALADEYTWSIIWEAVKRETKARNPGMDVRSREFLQTAGARFSEVIDKTQVYDSVLSRSANMRSKSLHMNMLTSFLAEPTTSINMLEDALRKNDRQQLKRTVGAVYGSVLLNSLLVSLVYAARDDDEEKTFWEKYLSSVAVEVLDGINPVTYYPVLRDIWSIGQGFDVERADMSLISDFANEAKNVAAAIKEVTNAAEEEEEAAMAQLKKALWGLTDSVAGLAGLPVKNIRRDIEAVRNVADTISKDLAGRKTTKMSLKDAVLADVMNAIPIGNLLYEKSRRDRLYYAAVGRDQVYADRLKAGYGDEAAYHSAVKMALRDHDSRIWEAAMAWNSNDLTRYMELAREIIGEGNFIQDDVVLAIRAEASAMEDSGTASASQKIGYFTNEKFGAAMGQNNTAMADIIRKDLIDTKIANGKTRAEAEELVESTARSQLKELYELSEITGAVAQNMLVRYGGYDREDAKEKVAEWKYEADYPELDGRITYTQYKRWEADGRSRGVSLETFTKVTEFRGGDTSEGVRSQEEVAAYINAMPISTAQKDALWLCFWSEKTLYKNAPWH